MKYGSNLAQFQTNNMTQLSKSLGLKLRLGTCAEQIARYLVKSPVMPRAVNLSTIRGEIPSLATSSPSSPTVVPISETVPGHGAGVVSGGGPEPQEPWSRLGSSSDCDACDIDLIL